MHVAAAAGQSDQQAGSAGIAAAGAEGGCLPGVEARCHQAAGAGDGGDHGRVQGQGAGGACHIVEGVVGDADQHAVIAGGADPGKDRAQVGLHRRQHAGEAKRAGPEGRAHGAVLQEAKVVVRTQRQRHQSRVLVGGKVVERKVHLGAGVADVQRKGRAIRAADVVRPRQRQETAGRLTGTGGVDILEAESLGDDFRVADEIAGVSCVDQWVEAEGHGIAQGEVAEALAAFDG